MLQPAVPDAHPSLSLIEASATLIAVAVAFCLPKLGSNFFVHIERPLARLARRQGLSVLVTGLAALLLRLAILPIVPIPLPFVGDDFSFLLGADTFLHGRLTNPTPAMWVHFETIHATMLPTYMTMYFPAQSLVMAASKLLLGHPWFGILITSALMCAAICWMLQAWLPATWALLGGMIAIVHLGLFSYWVNTYHSAGAIGALGGALILGALPRAMKTQRVRYWMLMAAGIALLVLSRPYEGLLLCLPVAAMLAHWIFFSKQRPQPKALLRQAALPLALVIAALAWLGYYDYRAFGKATTLPYTVDRATYAMAPYFVWQPPRPEPAYRHKELRRFYYEAEIEFFAKIHTVQGYVPQTLLKAGFTLLFYAGIALLPPLIMLRRVFLDKRMRFLMVCFAVMLAGLAIQVFVIPHYVSAFTAVFYAIGLQAMRHLRVWSPEGKPAGRMLVRMTVPLLLIMVGFRLCAGPLGLPMHEWPANGWNFRWYGPAHFGTNRAEVAATLEKMSGKQLVLVSYTDKHNPIDEWVYNSADIDRSKVIWAQNMDLSQNAELIHYYRDRRVWLVQVDENSASIAPYQTSNYPVEQNSDSLLAKNR
jgi:hypothetical protein